MSAFFPTDGVITMDTVDALTGAVTGRASQRMPTIDAGAYDRPMQLTPPSVDRMSSGIIKDNLGRSTNIIPSDLTEGTANMRAPRTSGPTTDLQAQNEILRQSGEQYKQEKLAVAGANFALNIMNAQLQYNQVRGQAQFNIRMARNQAQDSLFRGRQAASQAQSQGRAASDQAILAMAAQGQDVSSAGVQRIAGSYEAIAEQNAMQLEINSIKEALGFQLEEVNYDYQVRNAEIGRDMTVLSSALNLGAQAYGLGAL